MLKLFRKLSLRDKHEALDIKPLIVKPPTKEKKVGVKVKKVKK